MSKSKPTEEESEPGALGKRLVATLLGCLGKVGACRPGMDREGGLRRPRNLVPDSSKKKGGGQEPGGSKGEVLWSSEPRKDLLYQGRGEPRAGSRLGSLTGQG